MARPEEHCGDLGRHIFRFDVAGAVEGEGVPPAGTPHGPQRSLIAPHGLELKGAPLPEQPGELVS